MTIWQRHRGWLVLGALSLAALLLGVPWLQTRQQEAHEKLQAQERQNAAALQESRALRDDVAAEARLRAELGEKAYRALFTPPPRARLVAELRQIGRESGLHEFSLTMDEAMPLPAAGDVAASMGDVTSTTMLIKATAPDDRAIYDFTARTLAQLPGYLRLDKLTLRRDLRPLAAANPELLQAELTLRWLALNEELMFARQQSTVQQP